jgi:hypothetical protein
MRDCVAELTRPASRAQAGQKRQRHSSPDIHCNLAKQAWIEVDQGPIIIEPNKLCFKYSKVSELDAESAN